MAKNVAEMAAAKNKPHHIIFVPGLGDSTWFYDWTTRNWPCKVYFFKASWYNNDSFEQKLALLLKEIDSHKEKVSLIGASAGASLVLNAYSKRKNKIHRVVNVCGRIRKGRNVFPSLTLAAIRSKSFKDSVFACEKNLLNISAKDKKKILTIRALFDEIVPSSTTPIQGATNLKILSAGHTISIYLALSLYRNKIVSFLM
jgi:pimeloyl-ACP methyl ester carboxylesterase